MKEDKLSKVLNNPRKLRRVLGKVVRKANNDQLETMERAKAYSSGYKQGRFDTLMEASLIADDMKEKTVKEFMDAVIEQLTEDNEEV